MMSRKPGNSKFQQHHLEISPPSSIGDGDDPKDDEDDMGAEWTSSAKFPGMRRTSASFKSIGKRILSFFNPQPEQKGGRITQLAWLTFVAILAVGGIVVQVYTDVDLSGTRDNTYQDIFNIQQLVNNICDLIKLIGGEMALAYEYSNGTYDTYLQRSMDIQKAVDTALMWMSNWPSESDLASVPANMRVNLTSPSALRTAIRAQRDLRKAATNGLTEIIILNFYIPLIDQMSSVGNSLTIKAPRFNGWQDFLAMTPVFQMWMNYKKYKAVATKLVNQNESLSADDELFGALLEYYNKYSQFMGVASTVSTFAREKLLNLTSLDAHKEVERVHGLIMLLDLTNFDRAGFVDIVNKHDPNIEYVVNVLKAHVTQELYDTIGVWPQNDIFSAPIYAVAAAIAFATLFVHIAATWRQQKQIIKNYGNLSELNEALSLVYDCIPKSFIDTARSRSISRVQHFDDAGILVMDICNVEQMMSNLSLDSFVNVVEQTYELVEKVLRKYSCFKVDIAGSYFVFGSGAGGHHVFDHVLELVLVALDLLDDVHELSQLDQEDDYDVSLRIGVHLGPCSGRVVYLQVPRFALVGETMERATLVHATGLPMKVQVSGPVYERLRGFAGDIEFTHRGQLQVDEETDSRLELYWAEWADDGANPQQADYLERSSLAGSLATLNK